MISTVRLLVFFTCGHPNEAYVLAFVNKWKLQTKNNIQLGGYIGAFAQFKI